MVLKLISEAISGKLKKYDLLICGDIAQPELVLYLRFVNDVLQDVDVLRWHLSIDRTEVIDFWNDNYAYLCSESAGSFVKKLLDEESWQGQFEDEISQFFRNTSIRNPTSESLVRSVGMLEA